MTTVLVAHRSRVGAELLASVIARERALVCIGATTSLEEAAAFAAETAVDLLVVDLALCRDGVDDVGAETGAHVVGVAARLTVEALGAAVRVGATRVVDGEAGVGELLEVLRDLGRT